MNEHFDPSTGVRRYSPFLIQSKSNYQIKAAKVAVKGEYHGLGIPFSSDRSKKEETVLDRTNEAGMFCSTP